MITKLPCGLPANIVAIELKKNTDRFIARKAIFMADQSARASSFYIGQSVRTKLNDRHHAEPLFSTIAAIDGGEITLNNGRKFIASALVAA